MLEHDEKRALFIKALSSVAENVELLTGQRGNNLINLLMSILHQIAKDCGEQNLPQEIYEACLKKQAFCIQYQQPAEAGFLISGEMNGRHLG